jgi:predicted ArsR family transcriptional regulator
MKSPGLITVAEAAKRAGCTPRQMRRRLKDIDPDGKILVRQSRAPRGRFRVNVKELARSDCDWLAWVDETLDEERVRDIVAEEMTNLAEAFGRELRSLEQRVKAIEKILTSLGHGKGQRGTK